VEITLHAFFDRRLFTDATAAPDVSVEGGVSITCIYKDTEQKINREDAILADARIFSRHSRGLTKIMKN
jgi:hypothetical protein